MHAEEVNDEIGDQDLGGDEKAAAEEIDWTRVGRIYDKGTDINDVIKREIGRINQAFEAKLLEHDEELNQKTQ